MDRINLCPMSLTAEQRRKNADKYMGRQPMEVYAYSLFQIDFMMATDVFTVCKTTLLVILSALKTYLIHLINKTEVGLSILV